MKIEKNKFTTILGSNSDEERNQKIQNIKK